jgi:hypothetical protein
MPLSQSLFALAAGAASARLRLSSLQQLRKNAVPSLRKGIVSEKRLATLAGG